jgi:RimJ/RimL family protein N-acetyltransferase
LEATIFIGNLASRKAFEKAGFKLEKTLENAVQKRGNAVDEWLMAITVK